VQTRQGQKRGQGDGCGQRARQQVVKRLVRRGQNAERKLDQTGERQRSSG